MGTNSNYALRLPASLKSAAEGVGTVTARPSAGTEQRAVVIGWDRFLATR